MFQLARKLLFGAAFFLLAFAFSLGYADQYPDSAKSRYSTVTVTVVWLPSTKAVNRFCSHMMGQPIPKDGAIVGCYDPDTGTIYAVEPKSFNDHFRLEVLGHELWHALGAEHPRLP